MIWAIETSWLLCVVKAAGFVDGDIFAKTIAAEKFLHGELCTMYVTYVMMKTAFLAILLFLFHRAAKKA